MDLTTANSKLLTKKLIDFDKTSSRINIGQVFSDSIGNYLNEFSLFLAYFNEIPNCIQEIHIDCKKASNWLVNNHIDDISDWYFSKRYFNGNRQAEYDDIFYFLDKDLLVNFDTSRSICRFLFKRTEMSKIEEIIKGIKKFKDHRVKQKNEISLVVNTHYGIETKELRISKPKLRIEDNYNEDFIEIHKIIIKRLSKYNDKGILILHGKPGTGKTSYIRHLITKIKKKVIFLPPNMAAAITNPDLITIMIDNPNSVFVIEDAENILIDREKNGFSPVSAILNLSDGLLAECLNIQIICSFNTDISKVDTALIRKGRLIAKYEFKELEISKVNQLSKKLGFASNFNSPMTLAAIYNQDEIDFQQDKREYSIGFTA